MVLKYLLFVKNKDFRDSIEDERPLKTIVKEQMVKDK